jgi:hypothetical protein
MKVFQGLSFNQINSTILKPAFFSAALLFTSINVNATSYAFTDLGTNFFPTEINNFGQMTGISGQDAAVWNAGSISVLSSLNGFNAARTTGINDSGQIIGNSYNTTTGITRATLWDITTATPTDLGALTGSGSSFAADINNSGLIVGSSSLGATVWNGSTASALAGGTTATATDVNNLGQIVGKSGPAAVLAWGSATAAPTAVGSFCNFCSGYTSIGGINDAGTILVNDVFNQSNGNTLARFDITGKLLSVNIGSSTNTGFVQTSTSYSASSLNNKGQYLLQYDASGRDTSDLRNIISYSISEQSLTGVGTIIALVQLANLPNYADITNLYASNINDLSWIIGTYLDKSTNTNHGFLLSLTSPVPLPAAAWLFASGLGAFGVAKRRSKKA